MGQKRVFNFLQKKKQKSTQKPTQKPTQKKGGNYVTYRDFQKNVAIPLKIRSKLSLQFYESEKESLVPIQEFTHNLNEIREQYLHNLETVMGKEGYHQYNQLVGEEHEKVHKKIQPSKGPKMSKEEIQILNKSRDDSIKQFLTLHNIESSKLDALRDQTKTELKEVYKNAPVIQNCVPLNPNEIKDALDTDNSLLITFPNPVNCEGSFTAGEVDENTDGNFHLDGETIADENNGVLSLFDTQITTKNTGNKDILSFTCKAGLKFSYKTPQPGRIEIFLKLKSLSSVHQGSVQDEWGFSDCQIYGDNIMGMKILDGARIAQKYWIVTSYSEGGYPHESWDNSYHSPGTSYTVHWVTDFTYDKNSWVTLLVESRLLQTIVVNDMQVSNATHFSWEIEEIEFRMNI